MHTGPCRVANGWLKQGVVAIRSPPSDAAPGNSPDATSRTHRGRGRRSRAPLALPGPDTQLGPGMAPRERHCSGRHVRLVALRRARAPTAGARSTGPVCRWRACCPVTAGSAPGCDLSPAAGGVRSGGHALVLRARVRCQRRCWTRRAQSGLLSCLQHAHSGRGWVGGGPVAQVGIWIAHAPR